MKNTVIKSCRECEFELELLKGEMCMDKDAVVYSVVGYTVHEHVEDMVNVRTGLLRRMKSFDIGTPRHISEITTTSPKTVGTNHLHITSYNLDFFDNYFVILIENSRMVHRLMEDRNRYLNMKNGLNKFGVEIVKMDKES